MTCEACGKPIPNVAIFRSKPQDSFRMSAQDPVWQRVQLQIQQETERFARRLQAEQKSKLFNISMVAAGASVLSESINPHLAAGVMPALRQSRPLLRAEAVAQLISRTAAGSLIQESHDRGRVIVQTWATQSLHSTWEKSLLKPALNLLHRIQKSMAAKPKSQGSS
jgi:hypothetical protein